MALKPIEGTQQDVAEARAKHAELGESVAVALVMLILAVVGGIAYGAYEGKWIFSFFIVLGCHYNFVLARHHAGAARDIERVTITYSLGATVLVTYHSYNGGQFGHEFSTKWSNVAAVFEEPEGVVVQLFSGTRKLLPNECFESPEQRALVRAHWLEGRSLLRMILGYLGPEKRKGARAGRG